MKKNLIALLLGVVCMLSSCRPKPAVEPWEGKDNSATVSTVIIGHCGDGPKEVLGNGMMSTLGGATVFTHDMYKGATHINGVRLYLGADDAADLKVFITRNIQYATDPDSALYLQTVKQPLRANSWNYIKFSEPFKIPSDNPAFYIGYIGNSAGLLLGMETGEYNNFDVYFDSTTNPDKWMFFKNVGHGFVGKLAIQAAFSGGDYSSEKQFDIAVEKVSFANKQPINTEQNVRFDIVNNGVRTVNQIALKYKYNGKEYFEYLNNLDLANGMSKQISLNAFHTPGVAGNYDFTITATIRDMADEVPADNTYSVTQEVYSEGFLRNVLIEKFTGINCSNCPNGAEKIKHACAQFPENRTVLVAHHGGFGEEYLTVKPSLELFWFAKDTFAPAVMIDRNANYSVEKGYPIFDSQKITDTQVGNALAVPSPLKVEIEHSYNASTRQLVLTVKSEKLQGIDLPDARLNVFIIQDGIMETQTPLTELYRHDHTMREFLTDTWGDPVDFDGNTYSRTFNYTLPGRIGNPSFPDKVYDVVDTDVHIVAFIADYDASDRLNCQVHNAVSAKLVK